MRKKLWSIFAAALLVAGLAGTSYAASIDLGGSLRLRGVTVDNKDRTSGTSGVGFIEQRTRVNVNAKVDDKTRVFIQLQDSRDWGEEGATATTGNDAEAIDLSQGYIEFSDVVGQPLKVRVGRQALAYGEHRLVGSFEWSNNARRFDALKVMYSHEVFDVDAWYSKLDENRDGSMGSDSDFNGIYGTIKAIPNNTVDLYVLNDRMSNSSTGANVFDKDEMTYGIRVNGNFMDLDYTAEYATQSGDTGVTSGTNAVDRDATAYAVRAGWTFPAVLGGLRIGGEYTAGDGDDPNTADTNEGFNNLYPTNHYLYGFTDDVGWSNMKAWSLNASVKPLSNLKVAVEYWDYETDQNFNEQRSDGTLTGNTSKDNGSEWNLRVNHKLSKNVSCEAAYVSRSAGKQAVTAYGGNVGQIPADKTGTFAYLMVNVNF